MIIFANYNNYFFKCTIWHNSSLFHLQGPEHYIFLSINMIKENMNRHIMLLKKLLYTT